METGPFRHADHIFRPIKYHGKDDSLMKRRKKMDETIEWLGRLCHLNVAKTAERGCAPHKPLLLLCVMDMIEDGAIRTQSIPYSPELFFRFQCYWAIVYDRQRNKPDMRLPFHALGGRRDRIWTRYMEDGTPSRSMETTRLCCLDDMLWECAQDEAFRREARLRLITTYFNPAEQIALCARLGLPEPSGAEIANLRQSAEAYKDSIKKGRDSKFRSEVLLNYRFTCALTGYSLNTTRENMVEAAHIHQHALSGDDDPRNGLALTPDAHWMFDRGLWTAEPHGGDFIVIVARGHFKDSSPSGRTLSSYHEKALFFRKETALRPDPKYFAWHQKNRFLR
jgi:putative restriction endonuclease